jgi:ABC-type multidrug transport system ATPase subunit
LTQRVFAKKPHVIELFDVTQHYGVRPVLLGISLRIERGEVVVILGPNG